MKTSTEIPFFLRDKQAARILGISRSYFWELVKKNRLPAPIKLSVKVTVWRYDDIMMVVDNPEAFFGL